MSDKINEHIEQLKNDVENLANIEISLKHLDKLNNQNEELRVTMDFVKNIRKEAKRLKSKYQKLANGEIPANIAFIGAYNAGKSTIINCLFGENLCPAEACPTTSSITRFKYGKDVKISCTNKITGKNDVVSKEIYFTRVKSPQDDKNSLLSFEYLLPNPILKKICVWDTPGFENPKNQYDEERTLEAMYQVDIIIYVMDIEIGNLTDAALKILKKIRKDAPNALFYLIMNKADQKKTNRKEMLEENKKKHKELFREVYLFSATKDVDNVTSKQQLISIFQLIAEDKSVLFGGSLKKDQCQYEMKIKETFREVENKMKKERLHLNSILIKSDEIKTKIDKLKEEFKEVLFRFEYETTQDDFMIVKVLKVEKAKKWSWFKKPYAKITWDGISSRNNFNKELIWEKSLLLINLIKLCWMKDIEKIENKFRNEWDEVKRGAVSQFQKTIQEIHKTKMNGDNYFNDSSEAKLTKDRYLKIINSNKNIIDYYPAGWEAAKIINEFMDNWKNDMCCQIDKNNEEKKEKLYKINKVEYFLSKRD